VYGGDWSNRLCNGCYGRLLSLFEIKSSAIEDDYAAELLGEALLSAMEVDDQHKAEQLYRTSETRAERLTPESARFLATAEYIASGLKTEPQLEWSPAVIGLCKAFEAEVVHRVLRPLAGRGIGVDLKIDTEDKDFGRVAAYCADPSRKPPELGVFAHFLQTAVNSQDRRRSSVLLGLFHNLAAEWTGSHWLLDKHGLHSALVLLIGAFRNKAAHLDELGQSDYASCRELVIGDDGVLWKLVLSTD